MPFSMALIFFLFIFRVLFIVHLGLDVINRFLYLNTIFITHKKHKFGLHGHFLYLHTHSPGKAQASDKFENKRMIDVEDSLEQQSGLAPGVCSWSL